MSSSKTLSAPLREQVGAFSPMQPQPAGEPFHSNSHLFQLKWDGVRMLAFVTRDGVFLQNRRGRDKTLQYPELAVLKDFFSPEQECLLDGELVVLQQGVPSFSRILRRDFCRQEQKIKALTRKYPVIYCIFDIMFLSGDDLLSCPFSERQEILKTISFAGDLFYVNENFQDGLNLYEQVKAKGLEGVVAKEKDSLYLPGMRSRKWLKIKPRRQQLTVLGGMVVKNGLPASLLLGAYQDGSLLYVGRAGSGINSAVQQELKTAAAGLMAAEPPFENPPVLAGVVWLKPLLTVEAEFAEWTDNLKMRAPVIKGFSTLPPAEANL